MEGYQFSLAGATMVALPSGALWWAAQNLLCVSDLHLGKSERMARRGGAMLPPYETTDTILRLEADLRATGATTVVCLGDSFDDLEAERGLPENEKLWLTRLQAGRRWIWIEGNHDPGPVEIAGSHLAELPLPPVVFRHEAKTGVSGEISGHYHPKGAPEPAWQQLCQTRIFNRYRPRDYARLWHLYRRPARPYRTAMRSDAP